MNEDIVVKGWETALYDPDTDEAGFSEDDAYCNSVSGEENCLHAFSTQRGYKCGTSAIFWKVLSLPSVCAKGP